MVRPSGHKCEKEAKRLKHTHDEAALESVARQMKLLEASLQKAAALKFLAEQAMMSKDLTQMDAMSRAYYTQKKKEILEKMGLNEA